MNASVAYTTTIAKVQHQVAWGDVVCKPVLIQYAHINNLTSFRWTVTIRIACQYKKQGQGTFSNVMHNYCYV